MAESETPGVITVMALRFAEKIWALDLSPLSYEAWFSGRWWGTQLHEKPVRPRRDGCGAESYGPSFCCFHSSPFAACLRWPSRFTATIRAQRPNGTQRLCGFGRRCGSGRQALVKKRSSSSESASRFSDLWGGRVGPIGGSSWPGFGVVFCIRPHMALVVALSAAAATWFSNWRGFSPRRMVEVAVAVVITVIAFQGMMAQFGLGEADLEGIQEFAEIRSSQSLKGGSNIGGTGLTGAGVPMAVINVWFRPFLWEAHNPMAAVAALEMVLFWYLVWRNRRGLKPVLKNWRRSRLIAFAIPFLVLFTFMIGLVMGNMGLLARQRTPIFPFAFMVIAAGTVVVPVRRRRTALHWVARPPAASPPTAARR